MIVVAIIGILAAIAIPAYQDYIIRSKVTELVNGAGVCKTSVAEYYQTKGTMPTSLETTSFVEPTTPFEAPVTFEMPTRTESATELPPFETSEFFETVGEPVTIPPSNFVESTDHAFDEELVAQDQQIPSQMPAASTEFFESVGEPVPIPSEILDRCRVLKQQWVDASRANTAQTSLEQVQVHHPRLPHLRATIHLKQLKSAGVARPHFLIRCENLCPDTSRSAPATLCLPALVGLTRREQEVAQLVCQGRSNQEVADNARLSLPMVKKHLHAVFRKLQVPSRTRLVALAT